MNSKEYNKKIADARRNESRKFGFRQSSYINFKVEAGYFFCLYFLTEEARLTVKPMYADELWWDIWNATENKNEPLSLRGTGAYSLSGQVLASYKIAETTDDSKLADMFEAVFHAATAEILIFLTTNPDADKFFPDETKMDHDPDRLLYLMALIHHGREEEVLAIIKDARQNKHSCMFQRQLHLCPPLVQSRTGKRRTYATRLEILFRHDCKVEGSILCHFIHCQTSVT